MGKFELFFGCLGNGTTVCNKAVMENGDYKVVAHISNGGNIQMRVEKAQIPEREMEKILIMAEGCKEKFKEWFENLPEVTQYEKILHSVPTGKFIEFIKDERPIGEKLPKMREYFYTIA